jgi:hypothetical protein
MSDKRKADSSQRAAVASGEERQEKSYEERIADLEAIHKGAGKVLRERWRQKRGAVQLAIQMETRHQWRTAVAVSDKRMIPTASFRRLVA